jgi:VanZ family protein
MLRLSSLNQFPRWVYILASVLWATAIMVLLLLPRSSIPSLVVWQADKLGHAGLFAIQTCLLWFSMRAPQETEVSKNSLVLPFVLASVYGIITELIQNAAATRTADPFDALADITGAAIASYLILRYYKAIFPASSNRS